MVPPVRVIAPSPGLAVTAPSFTLPVPVQVTEALGTGATTMPAGRVSVKLVNGMLRVPLGLLSVMVNRVGSPTYDGEGLKLLLPAGACRLVTNMVALAAAPLCWPGLPPSLNSSPAVEGPGVVLAGIITVWLPPVVVDETFTVIRQRPASAAPRPTAAGTLPPVSTTEVPPGVAANVPPQVLVVLPGTMYILGLGSAPATVRSEVRLTLLSAEPVLSLTISIV